MCLIQHETADIQTSPRGNEILITIIWELSCAKGSFKIYISKKLASPLFKEIDISQASSLADLLKDISQAYPPPQPQPYQLPNLPKIFLTIFTVDAD